MWRDGKGKAYEGGHRVPLIARWPGRIEAGASSRCTTNLTDLFATAAEVVERDLPFDVAEDSFSLLPVLLGKQEQITQREFVFILGNGKDSAVAVCSGKWKLIFRYGDQEQRGHELYDLSQDPGELENVASQHPEITKAMAAAYQRADADGRTRN